MPAWTRSYLLMLKWGLLANRPFIPLYAAVEIMIAVGFIIGIGFFYPDMDSSIAKYLTTGAPTLILITVGLVMVPQTVAMSRTEGTFDYIWSLPVPRMVYMASDATIWVVSTLPSVVLAVALGALYYGFGLDISPLVIPAVILIALCGTFLGYAMAFAVPKPMMAQILTQVLIFAVMLFSPVMYSAEQLPGWLQAVHQVLPVQYMAELSRGTLTDLPVDLGRAFAVTGAWCVAGLVATYLLVQRRH